MEWYVLCIRGGYDKSVSDRLFLLEYQVYAPRVCRVTRHRRYKTRIVREVPLFPGYIFLRAYVEGLVRTLSTPNVLGFLGLEGVPTPVPKTYMDELIRNTYASITDSTNPVVPGDVLRVDDQIVGSIMSVTVESVSSKGVIQAVSDFMGKRVRVRLQGPLLATI